MKTGAVVHVTTATAQARRHRSVELVRNTVGLFPNPVGITSDTDHATVRRAQLTVCRNARNKADAALLLDALGLLR